MPCDVLDPDKRKFPARRLWHGAPQSTGSDSHLREWIHRRLAKLRSHIGAQSTPAWPNRGPEIAPFTFEMSTPRRPLRFFYSDAYVYDVGEAGPRAAFDVHKPRRVRDALVASGNLEVGDLNEPAPVADDTLLLVHTLDYVARLHDSDLLARLLLLDPARPWGKTLLQPFLAATGGTIAAAHFAQAHGGIGANLSGGYHHAQADKGEGFCAIADVAIAIRLLQRSGAARRTLIVDLDYHHGNGNAEIFSNDESVFTFSMHAGNWCWIDKRHNLDIELPPGTADAEYLAALDLHLPPILATFRPDFVFYVAGSDPFVEDLLGDFAISEGGMLQRDSYVTRTIRSHGLPLVIVTAGGYGPSSWRVLSNFYCWLASAEH